MWCDGCRRGEACLARKYLARKHPTQRHDDLARTHPTHEVWAFGSRVTGSAKEFSDLDLVVIGEKPLSNAIHANLVDDFSESDLPYKVDVIDWATTDTAFRQSIQRSSVVVQRAE